MPSSAMPSPIHPHGALERVSGNLWSVRGEIPGMPIGRRMLVARDASGGLLIHNPMSLEEAGMAALRELGDVSTIYVPGSMHRMDCAAYAARFPGARVLCASGARKPVSQKVEVVGSICDFEARDGISLSSLDGVGEREGILRVESSDGVSLAFNDALFNVPHQPGFMGGVARLLGSTGGPRVSRLARLLVVKDRAALGAQLERIASSEVNLHRIFPGHGDVIDHNPREVLQQVAAELG